MSSVEELSPDALESVLESEQRPIVVDFWSPWCAPCRALRPHLDRLADEKKDEWRFVAVNTEAHPEVTERFDVAALPTLAWFRSGKELSRLAGGVTLSRVAETLDALSGQEI